MTTPNHAHAAGVRRLRAHHDEAKPLAEASLPETAIHPGRYADQPFEEGVRDSIDADLRHRLISDAAFDLYSKRGYADGFDVDDWLEAEARVDHLLLDPQYLDEFKVRSGR